VRKQDAERTTMTCPTCGRDGLSTRRIDVGGKIAGRAPMPHHQPGHGFDDNGNPVKVWCPAGEAKGKTTRGRVRRYG
jgi:hypothetical protein